VLNNYLLTLTLKNLLAMKKTITLFSLIVMIATFSFAQEKGKSTAAAPATSQAVKKEGPQMDFKFTEHNFGELEEGPKAAVDFVFTNTGNKPLILTDVKASCGCTTPDWPKEPILPGQTNKIKVEYNTQGRPGDFTKSITITSNMEDGAPKMIYIKGKGSTTPVEGTPPTHGPHDGHNH
jgi:hypothetical protein